MAAGSVGQAVGQAIAPAYFGYPNGGGYNVNGYNGPITIGPQVGAFPNWTTTTFSPSEPQTSLDIFEELVNLTDKLELSLKIDNDHDENKNEWFKKLKTLIREEELNRSEDRLKALE